MFYSFLGEGEPHWNEFWGLSVVSGNGVSAELTAGDIISAQRSQLTSHCWSVTILIFQLLTHDFAFKINQDKA